jgi:hypothetical protein
MNVTRICASRAMRCANGSRTSAFRVRNPSRAKSAASVASLESRAPSTSISWSRAIVGIARPTTRNAAMMARTEPRKKRARIVRGISARIG